MAIVLAGVTQCPLCNQVLEEREELIAFPPFVDITHRLARFADATMHAWCFEACEERQEVEEAVRKFELEADAEAEFDV